MVKYIIAIAILGLSLRAADGDGWLHYEDGKDFPKVYVVTPEIKAVLDKDPVYQFVQRVNAAALKQPDWKNCYTCALYKSFSDEASDYTIELLKQKGLIK